MQILISCSREIVMLKHLSGKQIFGGGGGGGGSCFSTGALSNQF
jgi:hypothetical protein